MLGDLVWNTLSDYGPHYQLNDVLARLKELADGTAQPMDPRECHIVLLSLLDKIATYESTQNLKMAEEYLDRIASKQGVVEVISKKLYTERLVAGTGPNSSPTLHYIQSTLDRTILDRRYETASIKISLADTIGGFALGVEGMQLGEKRRIYVHPDLAYHESQPQMIHMTMFTSVHFFHYIACPCSGYHRPDIIIA